MIGNRKTNISFPLFRALIYFAFISKNNIAILLFIVTKKKMELFLNELSFTEMGLELDKKKMCELKKSNKSNCFSKKKA